MFEVKVDEARTCGWGCGADEGGSEEVK